jgi:hypothetical protein
VHAILPVIIRSLVTTISICRRVLTANRDIICDSGDSQFLPQALMTKMGVYSWIRPKKSSNEICGSARARRGAKVTSPVVTPVMSFQNLIRCTLV